MTSYDASLSIDAPREFTWLVLSAVVAWPEWLPTVSAVEALDGGSLKIGARYAFRQPKLRPATWVVTGLDPPRSFTWEARSTGLVMIASHVVEDRSAGKSNVTLRFSFEGFLGTPVGWLFRSLTERYLAQELAALRAVVERDFRSTH